MSDGHNHDEAPLWLKVLEGTLAALSDALFVLAGISNLDPVDGGGRGDALNALLRHLRLADPQPESLGAKAAAQSDGRANNFHKGDPERDIVGWLDDPNRSGNLRVTLVTASRGLTFLRSGVLWPEGDGTSFSSDVRLGSRHRLVWLDRSIQGGSDGGQRIGCS